MNLNRLQTRSIHPLTTRGMAFAGLLVDEISFVQASKEVTSVMGMPLISLTVNKSVWELDTPDNASSPASLILAIFYKRG